MTENELIKASLSKTMALCSRREYCADDIRTRLKSWGISDNGSEKIINILYKENFINDIRYSKAFVKDKFIYNKWGKVKIAAHLKIKKIPPDIIKTALDSIDNEDYIKILKEILSDHRRFIKARSQYDLKGKLLRYGLSKGFESDLLYGLLNETEA
ncbi:MAG: RecX family transcriptional regulator [Bacteroidales bacterium]|nr:RecX family transcriptional regulator [Bacteroidales bacterium]